MNYYRVGQKLCMATLAMLAMVAGSRTVEAQRPFPKNSVSAPPRKLNDAADLGARAATSLMKSRSIDFTMTAKPVTPGFGLAAVTTGEGTLVLPDRAVFKGTLQNTPALTAPFVLAACGTEQYAEMGDGNFMKMDAMPNIGRLLFSSDTSFVISILKKLEQASAPKMVKLNNADMWYFSGVIPNAVLTKFPGRKAATGAVKAEIWIRKMDTRLKQLVLTGPMMDTDTPQTSRTFTIQQYVEKKELTVPRGQLPCGGKSSK